MTPPQIRPHSYLLRAQLRLLLLAAAETCWIYTVTLLLGALADAPRQVSPLGILFVYWIALQTGRILPSTRKNWRLLQALAVAIAGLTILGVIRLNLYSELPSTDVNWLPDYFGRLAMLQARGAAEQISTLALIFAFTRGLGFAQRPLTLWTVGYQFRLGIVVFFGVALLSAFTMSVAFSAWVFLYFALSLPAIALARVEEAGQERPLNAKWALVLLAAVSATLLLGFAATQIFTLDAINAFFAFLAPLGLILAVLAALIAIPLLFVVNLLAEWLTPFFDFLRGILQNLGPNWGGGNQDAQQFLERVSYIIIDLLPYLRLGGVALGIIVSGWLVARALNKRIAWQEHELFATQDTDALEKFAPTKAPRKARGRFARRALYAENVRRIYAALLVQAAHAGLERRAAETPLEFLPRLCARFPANAYAFDKITNAYVATHYAQRPATDAQVRELRALWQDTRRKLQPVQNKK